MESYAKGETEPALLEETIGANLERTVAAFPDREAMVEFATGRRWTWREFDRDVDLLARGLLAAGIDKGDRVGIWGPNSARWTLTQYAAAKVGAILVNLNPSYRTHEFSYAINQSGTRLLVAASRFKTSDYRAMVEETRSTGSITAGTLERVVYHDTDDWDDLVAAGESLDADALNARQRTLEPDDPINIQYTSGTTGYPKGATLSHRNILNNGYLTTELIGFTEEDRLCIPVPFYHCFGMVMANSDAPATARRWSSRRPGSTRASPSTRSARNAARRCTACPRCSSRCSTTRRTPATTWRAPSSAPGSWPARSARSR
jgi:fatty-acyl-CoA synthase